MSTLGAYFRLSRVGWILVREGVISALPSEDLPPSVGIAKSFVGLFARNRSKSKKRSDRLAQAVERLGLSARAYGKVLRVARTLADLDHSDAVRAPHVAEAVHARLLDRDPQAGLHAAPAP